MWLYDSFCGSGCFGIGIVDFCIPSTCAHVILPCFKNQEESRTKLEHWGPKLYTVLSRWFFFHFQSPKNIIKNLILCPYGKCLEWRWRELGKIFLWSPIFWISKICNSNFCALLNRGLSPVTKYMTWRPTYHSKLDWRPPFNFSFQKIRCI